MPAPQIGSHFRSMSLTRGRESAQQSEWAPGKKIVSRGQEDVQGRGVGKNDLPGEMK